MVSSVFCYLRCSVRPEWITGGLGSVASQGMGFFSSSFTGFPPFWKYFLPLVGGLCTQ